MIPIPERLQSRPVVRGYPVPYINLIGSDGVPDFRVIDDRLHLEVVARRACALCGEKLGRSIFFTGGPHVAAARQYFEPPVHLECLLFAMQTCPYILGKTEHCDVEAAQAAHPEIAIRKEQLVREECWKITKAGGYVPFFANRHVYLRPEPVIFITDALYPEKMNAEDWRQMEETLRTA